MGDLGGRPFDSLELQYVGNGTFTKGETLNTEIQPAGITTGDLTGDGYLDLVIARRGTLLQTLGLLLRHLVGAERGSPLYE